MRRDGYYSLQTLFLLCPGFAACPHGIVATMDSHRRGVPRSDSYPVCTGGFLRVGSSVADAKPNATSGADYGLAALALPPAVAGRN